MYLRTRNKDTSKTIKSFDECSFTDHAHNSAHHQFAVSGLQREETQTLTEKVGEMMEENETVSEDRHGYIFEMVEFEWYPLW